MDPHLSMQLRRVETDVASRVSRIRLARHIPDVVQEVSSSVIPSYLRVVVRPALNRLHIEGHSRAKTLLEAQLKDLSKMDGESAAAEAQRLMQREWMSLRGHFPDLYRQAQWAQQALSAVSRSAPRSPGPAANRDTQ